MATSIPRLVGKLSLDLFSILSGSENKHIRVYINFVKDHNRTKQRDSCLKANKAKAMGACKAAE